MTKTSPCFFVLLWLFQGPAGNLNDQKHHSRSAGAYSYDYSTLRFRTNGTEADSVLKVAEEFLKL